MPKERVANLQYRQQLRDRATKDQGLQKSLKEMCKRDPLFYINCFCYVYEPRTRTTHPFITWEFQDETITALIDSMGQYDVVVEKSRDMGASWMAIVAPEWAWHFHDKSSFLLGSRKEDLVDSADDPDSLMWKIDFLHKHQDPWIVPWCNRTKLHLLNCENGSVIDGESTNANFGVGGRRLGILLDEFAKMQNDYEIKDGTADVSPCRWYVSTHNGTHTCFYELCQTGDVQIEGKYAQRKLRLHWTRHPEKARGLYMKTENGVEKPSSPWRDREVVRRKNRQEIAQNIDIDPQGSSFQFFQQFDLDLYSARDGREPTLTGHLDYDDTTGAPYRFTPDPDGPLRLWLNLMPDGSPPPARYVGGADISAGAGSSNSVCSLANTGTGEKIAELATPTMSEIAFATYCVALSKWFATGEIGAKLVWEDNGSLGVAFTKRVIEMQYTHVYWRHDEKRLRKKQQDMPGWHSGKGSKLALLKRYREDLGKRFINRSKEALRECALYVHAPTGEDVVHAKSMKKDDPTGAKKNHGDRVIADALCYMLVHEARKGVMVQARSGEMVDLQKAPIGSLGWRMMLESAGGEDGDMAWL